MKNLFVLAFVAMAISFIATPLVKRFAYKIGAVDVPKDDRRVHEKPTPLLGGLAIYIAFVLVAFFKKGSISTSEWGIMAGATIIVIGGILDDKFELKPLIKLAFQLVAAVCLLAADVQIETITNPFGNLIPFFKIGYLYVPLSLLWIVGLTNAINLIDGLDGLAAGSALISALTILLVAILKDRFVTASLTAILSGAILGFLPYNFNPASIFMGDTGAQLLGFILAAISIEGAVKSATAIAIAVPILALGLPIFDTVFAMVRRRVNGKPMMQGDRGHLHHRLLDMGLSQRQAVMTMYFISAALGGIAIIALQISSKGAYFLLAAVIVVIVVICWRIGLFKHRE
jgi:UDP-GlcNAc:undecaprenyl-phosphate GlcNAc-1-phosphate transferase